MFTNVVNVASHTGTLVSVTGNVTANNGMFTNVVNVASHTGTVVSVTGNVNGGNLISAALVQGATVSSSGNVVTVGVAASGFEDLSTDPQKWLDPAFVSLGDLQEIAVEGPGISWSACRDGLGSPWAFRDASAGETPNQAKIESAASTLANLTFNDVATEPADSLFSNPIRIKSTTADGLRVDWTIGERQAGDYPVKIAASSNCPPTRSAADGESEEDRGVAVCDWPSAWDG
jgi:hypothetical protein